MYDQFVSYFLCEQNVNHPGGVTVIFPGKHLNTMVVDALAPSVARTSTVMVLNKYE